MNNQNENNEGIRRNELILYIFNLLVIALIIILYVIKGFFQYLIEALFLCFGFTAVYIIIEFYVRKNKNKKKEKYDRLALFTITATISYWLSNILASRYNHNEFLISFLFFIFCTLISWTFANMIYLIFNKWKYKKSCILNIEGIRTNSGNYNFIPSSLIMVMIFCEGITVVLLLLIVMYFEK